MTGHTQSCMHEGSAWRECIGVGGGMLAGATPPRPPNPMPRRFWKSGARETAGTPCARPWPRTLKPSRRPTRLRTRCDRPEFSERTASFGQWCLSALRWHAGDSATLGHLVTCLPATPPPPPFLQSFRFIVDFWGGSLQIPEQVALIETLEEPTQFKVSVRLGPVFRIGGWRRGHGAEESRETPGGIKWGRTRLWDCMHGSSDSLPAVHHRAQHSPPSLASPHAGKD